MFRSIVLLLVLLSGAPATAQDLTLLLPEDMVANGFHKQILPRFKFKHRITVTPVTEGEADMAFGADGDRIFQIIGGDDVHLTILTQNAEAATSARTFRDWLQSDPGKAAIEGFEKDGTQLYTTEKTAVVVVAVETFDGDKAIGSRLALVHCGRCHVVDERNRMGGIGSTPSFAAIRGRSNWSDLFRKFFVENPHPSFTQVEGVTEPFDPMKQIHIAPVEITLEEIEAITAFVSTITPKELGRPVQSN